MKRQITKEQLNQLTKEEKIKLTNWCNEKDYSWYTTDGVYELGAPLLSIGQMFEFLDEYIEFLDEYEEEKTIITLVTRARVTCFGGMDFEDVELCDAIWQAVKETFKS